MIIFVKFTTQKREKFQGDARPLTEEWGLDIL